MNGLFQADFAFPVGSGRADEINLQFALKNVSGTAFSISNNYFISAGHVFENMVSYGDDHLMIGLLRDKHNWSCTTILEYEINKEYDLAIFRAIVPNVKVLYWSAKPSVVNTDVYSFGFPFALDVVNARINYRFFKGYIVNRTPNFELPNTPESYELSYMCPRGLSGAFILNQKNGEITGIVLGNSNVEIEIYNETVEESGSNEKIHLRKTETMKLGVGLSCSAAFEAHFDLLGSTLGEYLIKNGRIKSRNN